MFMDVLLKGMECLLFVYCCDRRQQRLDLGVEHREVRLVAQRVVREGDALHVHLDRVAVDARLVGRAVEQVLVGRGLRLAFDVARRGGGHGHRLRRAPALHGIAQAGAEVEVACLVVGRVGVRDVGRNHLLAFRPEVEGFAIEAKRRIQLVDHLSSIR
jgi:hypothetical protein